MTKYKYAGVTEGGNTVKGSVTADHLNDARVMLAEKGVYGLNIKAKPPLLKTELTKKRVPRLELMNFSRQLGAFVKAGIPIIDAIDVLRAETGNPRFREVLAEVSESLRSGDTLTGSVSAHPDVFPDYYVTILRSAEMTGHVDSVLDQLADYMERSENASRKIKSALTYPLVVMGVAIMAVLVIVIFALPRFRTFFDSLDADLPLVTRILMWITDFIGNYWWAIALGIGLFLLANWFFFRTNRGRHVRDRLYLNSPVIGDVVRYTIIERFCRVLGSMIRAGVQVPDAMSVASGATNNLIYQEALETARESMLQGEGMAGPITATGLFPGGVCQMVKVGEETGTLDDQLDTAAHFYAKEVEYRLDRLTALFEPILILTVGLIVGFVAIALVSAMYGIFDQVKVQ